ncbi:MAG: ATP-binding cassette domain-containing protein [Nitriliruptorales bacterium]|nr:ATP-binding cassette domain-containing protein [Nitriliruptorales bacterium]
MTDAVVVSQLVVVRGGQQVLHGLDWTIPAGQVVGLLGPSGSGKTTVLRCIVGVQRIRSGAVTVLGRPAGDPQLRGTVGYMTQAPAVYEDLSVVDNLAYGARVLGLGTSRVDEVVDQVDLAGRRRQLVRTLSGGERSRVSLGFALLAEPRVAVLDEPTVGLDPVLRASLWDLFHSLASAGTTLLVSTHVMDEAERCDRLLLLRDGLALADGSPQDLRDSTGTPTIEEAFLALAVHGTVAA